MHDLDLETDSVPIYAQCKFHLVGKHFSKGLARNKAHMKDDDRFDSGFHSSRNESLQNLNLGSDISECRLSSNEEKLTVSDFRNLSIKNDVEPYADEGCDLKSDVNEKERADHNYVECVDVKSENTRIEIEETFRQDDDGDTHLHIAIIQLLENLALSYIQLAPDHNCLNIRNNYLQTPLHLAVITRQPLIARKLITSGALVDARDHKGNSPLHIASKEGYAIAAKVLLEPVRFEEVNGNRNQLPYQQIPQNLEGRNYDGQVCVHLAAERGHLATLEVLLNSGADINARDGKSGRTILHYAAESAYMPLLKFLLKYPTLDINAVTYGGLTAVMLAKGWGHEEVVNVLLEHGAYYDSQDSDEESMTEDCYDDIQICRTSVQQFK